jgi:hypothetical protein
MNAALEVAQRLDGDIRWTGDGLAVVIERLDIVITWRKDLAPPWLATTVRLGGTGDNPRHALAELAAYCGERSEELARAGSKVAEALDSLEG